MCVNVGSTERLLKKKYYYKVVFCNSASSFRSLVSPLQRQRQPEAVSQGTILSYRTGEVTNPPHGSPGIYVFTQLARAKQHAKSQAQINQFPVALIKVMASTDTEIALSHHDSDLAIVRGPVLVVKRERISR